MCVSESIFCIVRKNWPYPPTTSGSYGREGGRQTKYGWISNFKTSLQVKLFGILFCLIHCYFIAVLELHSVGFRQVEVYLRCVLKCKKFGSHFFHVNSYYYVLTYLMIVHQHQYLHKSVHDYTDNNRNYRNIIGMQ